MPRFTEDANGNRFRLPLVISEQIMGWIYEASKTVLRLTVNQVKFSARLRKNKQITFPHAVLKFMEISLQQHGVFLALEDLINSEFVLEVKAVRYQNTWYRISTEVEQTK